MKKLIFFVLFSVTSAWAGVFYYGSSEAVNLENTIGFSKNTQKIVSGETNDPSSSGYAASEGSLLLRTSGTAYVKTGGTDTDWADVLTNSSSINDLTDVIITSAASGDILYYNNTNWANGPKNTVSGSAPIVSSGGVSPIISITQADSSTDGYISSGDWDTFNNKSTVANISDLGDVNDTAKAEGKVLAYDSGTSKWIASDDLSGGSSGATSTANENEVAIGDAGGDIKGDSGLTYIADVLAASGDIHVGDSISYHRSGSYAAKRSVKIYDAKSSTTHCGGLSAGANTRTLSTAIPADDDWFDFVGSSDKFILEPGVYNMSASFPGYEVNRHQVWFRFDVDGSPYVSEHCVGNVSAADASPIVTTHSDIGGCVIELAVSTDIDVQHFVQTTKSLTGAGVATSSGQSEICGWLYIEKWR